MTRLLLRAPRTRSLRLLATLLLGVALALGCQSDEEKLAGMLTRAAELSDEGEYGESLIQLKLALQLAPQSPDINVQIADTLQAMGQRGDAAFYYGEAYRLDPSLTRAALAKAPALYADDPEGAEELVQQVLEREPENARAYVIRAELELVRSATDKALAAAFTAIELGPEDPVCHRTLGTVYRAILREKWIRSKQRDDADFEAAIAAFRKADELAGGSWFDRKEIALVYTEWPDHREPAQQSWDEAFEAARATDSRPAMLAVAEDALQSAQLTRQYQLVRWALRRKLELDPGDVHSLRRLSALERKLPSGDEKSVWKTALKELPNDPHVHAAYAVNLNAQGRRVEAIGYLEGLRDPVAGSAPVLYERIHLYMSTGDVESAQETLARLERDHPGHTLTRLGTARIQLDTQQVEEAVAILRDLSRESEHPDLLWLLAIGENRSGNTHRALAATNRAIEASDVPRQQLHRLRLRLQGRLQDWEMVLQSAREMRRQGIPLQTAEQVLLVQALYETGRADTGRVLLESLVSISNPTPNAVLAFARYESSRQPERARELLEGTRERHPGLDVVTLILVRMDVAANEQERALQRLQPGADGRELTPVLLLTRAKLLHQMGRSEEAEVDARAAFMADSPPRDAARVLAAILEQRGAQAEAIAMLEKRGDALDARELWLLAQLHTSVGNQAAAREALEAALARDPQLHVARNDLAYLLAEQGESLDRAVDLAREARRALPESAAVADTLGWVYYRRGLHEPAVAEFRAALELAESQRSPEHLALFHYHLGLALQALGQVEEAKSELDRALDIEPEHEGAKAARATLGSATPKG